MSAAPWPMAQLGDVCRVIRGITFPASAKEASASASNVCCLRTTNIQREVDWGDVYFVPREFVKREEQLVRVGDVLMSMANSYELVGKVAIAREVPQPAAFGAFLAAIRPSEAIEVRFLFHWLRTSDIQRELREGSSQTTNIANISISRLAKLRIPVPPLSEQKRIADKLDRLLAAVDTCKARLDAIPDILKRFRQSVLAAAVSGELTEEWRGKRGEKMSWQLLPVANLAVEDGVFDGPFGSHLKSDDYVDKGARVVRLENIGSLVFRDEKKTFISNMKFESLRRHTLKAGDIVLSSFINEEVRVCRIPHLSEPAINKADCFCIRVDSERAIPRFVELTLASRSTYRALRERVHGATRPRINLGQLKAYEIALPSIAEQQEIVRRADALLMEAARLVAKVDSTRARLEQLASALLASAFRGGLPPANRMKDDCARVPFRVQPTRESYRA